MANVVNRTTKQYLTSVNTPDFPTEDWIINPDLSAVAGVPSKFWNITGDVITEMSDAEKDTAELRNVKEDKSDAIDAKTERLISEGFIYATKRFSLSLSDQTTMAGMHQVKDDVALTYPISWNTIDNRDTYDIEDAADLDALYLACLGAIRTHLDSGTSLKGDVRASTTIAEVDAVVENR